MLGSGLGSVISWSDTQVVASVAVGSTSGTVQISQGDAISNSFPFTVNTSSVTGVSPTSGMPGTQVTISGSGFGSAQGSGMAWLGTAPAQVTSWSDGQVIATVASGSTSGTAQILQNGVLSNSVPFKVNIPQITTVTPSSGGAGTVVTITGSGFGNAQGSGSVWIGSTAGLVSGWGDTQVVASVATNAVSGIIKVEQNGIWSNAVSFTVPATISGQAQVTIVPTVLSMAVGDTRSLQALNSSGQIVTGLSWSTSDPNVATLSTDDPPLLTAVNPGNVTITAGSGSADLTVYPGTVLPLGTVIWSNPGDASGVQMIVPAVPSATGLADVFALQKDCNVQAIQSDGTVAWTSSVGQFVAGGGCKNFVPDFQGGLVTQDPGNPKYENGNYLVNVGTPGSVQKFDGTTGASMPAYAVQNPNYSWDWPGVVVHPDGTIFTIDGDSVVAIDPSSGTPKFSVKMEHSTLVDSACPSYNSETQPTILSELMIAGDGYLYVPFDYTTISNQGYCTDNFTGHWELHGRLLRVGTQGDSSEMAIGDWAADTTITKTSGDNWSDEQITQVGQIPSYEGKQRIITTADQGALLTAYTFSDAWCAFTEIQRVDSAETDTNQDCTPSTFNYTLIGTSGGSVGARISLPSNISYIEPDLQAKDGDYYGLVDYANGPYDDFLAKFDASGNIKWSAAGYYPPQIATSDGGVIATSYLTNLVATFDKNGSQTSQISNLPTQSWLGYGYRVGSIDQVAFSPPSEDGTSFWSSLGGNRSLLNPVAVKLQHTRVFVPYGLYNQATYGCTVNNDGSTSCIFSTPVIDRQDSQFRTAALQAIPAWKSVMDIRIPASGNATLSNYLGFATATGPVHYPATNEIVAYIGHGIGQPDSPQNGSYQSISMGLVFPASQCLWFLNLQPPPLTTAPWVYPCQNDAVNGVTQKPRIIFLGMCGFTSQMLNDWAVNANTQAIIYPVYDSNNTEKELDLGLAGNEFMDFIQSLVRGATVEDALSHMNTVTQADIAQHPTLPPTERWSWRYDGKNLSFTTP